MTQFDLFCTRDRDDQTVPSHVRTTIYLSHGWPLPYLSLTNDWLLVNYDQATQQLAYQTDLRNEKTNNNQDSYFNVRCTINERAHVPSTQSFLREGRRQKDPRDKRKNLRT